MDRKQKLSELMKLGATELKPYKHDYFSSDHEAACALGCAFHTAKVFSLSALGDVVGYDLEEVCIGNELLTDDMRTALIDIDGYETNKPSLYRVISRTNDSISRDRPIEITEQLGY